MFFRHDTIEAPSIDKTEQQVLLQAISLKYVRQILEKPTDVAFIFRLYVMLFWPFWSAHVQKLFLYRLESNSIFYLKVERKVSQYEDLQS